MIKTIAIIPVNEASYMTEQLGDFFCVIANPSGLYWQERHYTADIKKAMFIPLKQAVELCFKYNNIRFTKLHIVITMKKEMTDEDFVKSVYPDAHFHKPTKKLVYIVSNGVIISKDWTIKLAWKDAANKI